MESLMPHAVAAMSGIFKWPLLKGLFKRKPISPSRRSVTLLTVPTDVLHIIFQILRDETGPITGRYRHLEGFDREAHNGAQLLPLSETCHYLREEALPWIFREVYNWNRRGEDVWPDTLWPFFVTVHLRDRSVRHPADLALPLNIFSSLPMLPALTKVTVRIDPAVPAELIQALSLVPNLRYLEIHQARFDGTPTPLSLPFAALESLQLSICGFQGCFIRSDNIDRAGETRNVFLLLRTLTDRLTRLQISGDYLSLDFLALDWVHLWEFTVTDHTPTPYIAVPDLICRMPALRDLSILFSADATRNAQDIHPPFQLGIADGGLLNDCSPLLTTITLSNSEPADPLFAQLPPSLESLHLLTMRDWFVDLSRSSTHRRILLAPLTSTTVITTLQHISHLQDLAELSLTLNIFPTAHLIESIAAIFPRLRILQWGHSTYGHGNDFCEDVRDETIVTALHKFPFLTDLRIALDFTERDFQEGPQKRAAYWFLERLPNVRTIAFLWNRGVRYYGYPAVVWKVWDRSLLLRPPPPSSPPPSIHIDFEAPAIPPWEIESDNGS
ncbi:hypothetical protein DFH07DRAFT_221913 [Mycena maculata]|uniref:Uncharacterized protein n=1 Tax=Mycena maculata TaxID=230809 RepID=A0AAD7HVI6_9AGAR|nr:hypothetical protein DFH07DRAFT_221913 [Mycena maculata]